MSTLASDSSDLLKFAQNVTVVQRRRQILQRFQVIGLLHVVQKNSHLIILRPTKKFDYYLTLFSWHICTATQNLRNAGHFFSSGMDQEVLGKRDTLTSRSVLSRSVSLVSFSSASTCRFSALRYAPQPLQYASSINPNLNRMDVSCISDL